jgi:AcrR family transcriptional regulator
MVTRAESAAATRKALLAAAAALLDGGGPEAVTLREVGSRSGVSRSAPYGHFPDKESLLTAVATGAWAELGDSLQELVDRTDLPARRALQLALMSLVTVGRSRPHRYRLMFTPPAGDPTEAVRAAERTQQLFLQIVAAVVGDGQAWRYGGLLLTSAHGITGLELSGHLVQDKWPPAAELVELLISLLPHGAGPTGN